MTRRPTATGDWSPGPEDFHKAYEAVGRFLWNWALVESQINQLITKGLKLDLTNSVVVTANVQLRDKLHICATIVALQIGRPEDWREDATDWLDKARRVSLNRNTVAHNVFMPWQQGVRFYHTSARGELNVEPIDWRYSDIDAKIRKMDRIQSAIEKIVKDISPPRRLIGRSLFGGLGGIGSAIGESEPSIWPRTLGDWWAANLPAQEGQSAAESNDGPAYERRETPPVQSLAEALAEVPHLPPLAEPEAPPTPAGPSRKPKQEKKPRKSAKKEAD